MIINKVLSLLIHDSIFFTLATSYWVISVIATPPLPLINLKLSKNDHQSILIVWIIHHTSVHVYTCIPALAVLPTL